LNIEKNENEKIKILEKMNNLESKINLAKIFIKNTKEKKDIEKEKLEKTKENLEKFLEENKQKNNLSEKNKIELYDTLAENYYFLAEKSNNKKIAELFFLEKSLDLFRQSLKIKYKLNVEKNILFIEKKIKKIKEEIAKEQNKNQDKKNNKNKQEKEKKSSEDGKKKENSNQD
jgi:hypothetical protein